MQTTISVSTREPGEFITSVREAIASARYVVNAQGNKTDIVLPLAIWEKLLIWMENQEDRSLVREMLPRLKMGPEKAGALSWEEVADEWTDETSV